MPPKRTHSESNSPSKSKSNSPSNSKSKSANSKSPDKKKQKKEIFENMDDINSGYSKLVGGLKSKKIDDSNYEYHAEVKDIHLNTAGMAHGGFLTFIIHHRTLTHF